VALLIGLPPFRREADATELEASLKLAGIHQKK
jgi:hypothetical protein